MENTLQRPPHVAIVPTPGLGHLIPLIEFAKRLVLHHNFRVTILIPNDGSSQPQQNQLLQTLPDQITSIFLPPVSFDDMVDVKLEVRIALTLSRSLEYLRESLKVLAESTRLVALVVDLFGVEAFDVAKEFSIPSYIFYLSTGMALSLAFYLPKLDEEYTGDYKDLPEPVRLPGCVPIKGSDLVEVTKDRSSAVYKGVLNVVKRYPLADGFLVNSFVDLEPGAFKALMEGNREKGFPPVYPVGPVVRTGSTESVNNSEYGNGCLKWLDEQPLGSVLYVCFGSGGTLSFNQLQELALGLEKSEHRFIWVIKTPNDNSDSSFFGEQNLEKNNPLEFLPNGFLNRTKGFGLVVQSWAPQAQILSHGSVGGFLSHCGWNSSLESIVNGVPLIAWPLYAEQKMNAVLLADDLKVALRVSMNENGLVGSEDIARYVKELIDGEEGKFLKSNMNELKDSAWRALSQDGDSTKLLSKFVSIWKSK